MQIFRYAGRTDAARNNKFNGEFRRALPGIVF